jgi:hypothetical protein
MTACRYCRESAVSENQCAKCRVVQVVPKMEGKWLP